MFLNGLIFFCIFSNAFATIDTNIDKKTGIFLNEITEHKGKQLYDMTPIEARKAMDKMQKIDLFKMPKIKITKIIVPTQDMKIPVIIVKPLKSINKILPVLIF